MPALTLEIDRTCACCWKFRLCNDAGVIVWRNRTYPHAEGEQGARTRMTVWAKAHGYRIIEAQQRKAG